MDTTSHDTLRREGNVTLKRMRMRDPAYVAALAAENKRVAIATYTMRRLIVNAQLTAVRAKKRAKKKGKGIPGGKILARRMREGTV